MSSNQSISNDFRILGKLGEGSFAEVFKVKSTRNNTSSLYAVKRLKKRFQSIEEVNHLPEITACRCLQGHPNIVRLFEVLFDSSNGYVALVFELLDYNLYEYVKIRNRPCDERQALLFIYQLLKAIEFLHSKNLFHRDIKPENCMINKSTLELKLVDFGSCRFDDHNSNSDKYFTEYVSTRWYRAPECILTSGSYGKAVDIWAVGCMLYELLTTRPLFPGKHELDQINRIHQIVGSPSREVLSQFRKNPNTQISFSFPCRPPQDLTRILPPTISKNTIDLLKKLLIYDPTERITASEALAHPAFGIYVALDKRWHDTGEIVPYSVFFTAQIAQASKLGASYNTILNSNSGNSDIQNDSNSNNPNPNELHSNNFLNQNLNNYLTGNKIEFPEHQSNINHNKNQYNGKPMNIHEPPAASKSFAAPHHNYYSNLNSGIENQQQQQQINQSKEQAKQSIPTGQMLKEARLRAAQRIREYNKKKYGANPIPKVKIPPQQQNYVPQPLIDKNKTNYNKANQGTESQKIVYQKPAPEIVQPRVPKKQFRYK
ncbi:hypothetical protein M9Y10_028369 [Tritrichomonas musculus]|uniref:Protein kinase domain-containing protein n=1 Tax=Tritrichomonas musculus TaxID=1915356 RepID=A0ABR2KJL2_9EUKA